MTKCNAVLITAAGTSQRFGQKKEYLSLSAGSDITVLSASLYAFVATGLFTYYAITVPQGETEVVAQLLAADKRLSCFLNENQNRLFITEGGASRQESVYKGLVTLADKAPDAITHVLVHDGARPWVSGKIIATVLKATQKYGAAVPMIPVTDTQKEVDETGKIIRHLERDRVIAVQTPQGFVFEKLLAAHRSAEHDGEVYTDDSEIYAHYCNPVYICPGTRENKKITYREDLEDSI